MSEPGFELRTDEGLTIRGDLRAPTAERAPVVVCAHGFKGFKDWGFWPEVARRLSSRGYGVVRFNFSHSGIGADLETFSEQALFETGTYSREVEDLRQVIGALVEGALEGTKTLDRTRLALLGHSRGGVAALAVAAREELPVRSVALWNPVSTVLWWDARTRQSWRETGFWQVVNSRTGQVFRMSTALLEDAERNRHSLEPTENAKKLGAPLLVVVASEDEAVAPEQGRRIAQAAPAGLATLRELPATGHTFGAAHPFRHSPPPLEAALAATLEHFDRTLRKGAI